MTWTRIILRTTAPLCFEITKTWTKYAIFQILLKLGFLARRKKVKIKPHFVVLVFFLFTEKNALLVFRVNTSNVFLPST